MTPLWALLPGIQASGFRCAARHVALNSRTVLGGKGSLRRATPARPCLLRALLQQKTFATGGSAGNQMQQNFFVY